MCELMEECDPPDGGPSSGRRAPGRREGDGMAVIDPRVLGALARRHRSGSRDAVATVSVELIARLLTEIAAGRAVAVPAAGGGGHALHPLGRDLRIVHRPGSGLAVCQQRRRGVWTTLPEVRVGGAAEVGFWVDAAALRREAGRLDPELELALPGGPRGG